ncbi:hypothetical protein EJ04DRAFT_528896 [Polyplosphaeria fusca]|uniref:Uncharacterized protein n=1 Tax=Polyplosphaeria fusca TaxID=682080 RepID=A0A9P4QKS1_9PLEO|nr:hypothetical protein EJ04DRAFT_528896 [Polyplosphaeria fusca]
MKLPTLLPLTLLLLPLTSATPSPPTRRALCDRRCASEAPSNCGEGWVAWRPGGGSCWACCDADTVDEEPYPLPSIVPDGPRACDRRCAAEAPECGVGRVAARVGGGIGDAIDFLDSTFNTMSSSLIHCEVGYFILPYHERFQSYKTPTYRVLHWFVSETV